MDNSSTQLNYESCITQCGLPRFLGADRIFIKIKGQVYYYLAKYIITGKVSDEI
jgi:hypothetical protein